MQVAALCIVVTPSLMAKFTEHLKLGSAAYCSQMSVDMLGTS